MPPALFPSPTTSRASAQRDLARAFTAAGLPSPALDARLLLCAALAIDHAGLIRDPDIPLGAAATVLRAFAARRLAREPVSRILGRREFWGLPFTITPAVLDPRPDTEILVETVLRAMTARRGEALVILDLGTGSGAILCALLHELTAATGLGVDRSFQACRVARDNLRALGLDGRGCVIQGAWTEAVAGSFDIVVSNPPYIRSDDLASLDVDVRAHDPALALDGGADGLAAYRAILPAAFHHLAPDGIAAFEVGSTQAREVAAMARAAGFGEAVVVPDLAGHGRVVVAKPRASLEGFESRGLAVTRP